MTDPSNLARELEQFTAETHARLTQVETAIEELEDTLLAGADAAVGSPASSPAGEPTSTALTLRYPSLEAWVVGHFARVYIRPHGGALRWCAQWWRHAEAISRLEALWRTWEALRVQPLGLDIWLRERLDHHLPQLLAANGPFASCTPDKHHDSRDLATAPAPPNWWPTNQTPRTSPHHRATSSQHRTRPPP